MTILADLLRTIRCGVSGEACREAGSSGSGPQVAGSFLAHIPPCLQAVATIWSS